MKHLIIVAAAAFTMTTANAQYCTIIGNLSESIMKARQNGVSMSDIMNMPSATSLGKAMTIDAFKEPRYSTEEFKQRAITDFRANWELACYEFKSKKKGGDV